MPLKKVPDERARRGACHPGGNAPREIASRGPVTISLEFQPLAAVGGDFLDYFQLMDGTAGLYLCDVSGKGLPAALNAALAVGTLRSVHKTGTSPSDARPLSTGGVNPRHAVIQYAVFDPRTGDLQIANCTMLGPRHCSSTPARLRLRMCSGRHVESRQSVFGRGLTPPALSSNYSRYS
jgi:hypothetical protein